MEDSRKVSRFEMMLIIAIAAMSVFFVLLALVWPRNSVAHRDDALMANTALSVGRVNSNNGMNCVVNDCPGGADCPHHHGNAWIGYYDPSGNCIVGEKMKGYNEEKRIHLNGKTYKGDLKTMIIEVKAEDNDVQLSWTAGAQ